MQTRTKALIFALVAATPMLAVAGGGTVVKLDGVASVERRSGKVPAKEATPLYSGDTLRVMDQGVAQLRFEDDSVFVVPGAATFRVDRFVMPFGGSGGTALYTLVEGSVRTITGSIKGEYALRTDEATITVKGSAYKALLCKGACAKKYKGGLYVQAESGEITVTSGTGGMTLKRGMTGLAERHESAVVRVKVSPFDDPQFAAGFGVSTEFEVEVHPPRIEPEKPASKS